MQSSIRQGAPWKWPNGYGTARATDNRKADRKSIRREVSFPRECFFRSDALDEQVLGNCVADLYFLISGTVIQGEEVESLIPAGHCHPVSDSEIMVFKILEQLIFINDAGNANRFPKRCFSQMHRPDF